MRLLADTRAETALSDTEKFDIRMAFFQYLTPETRLRLLEKRRSLLEEQVKSFKAYKSSNRNQDHYQSGLLSHKVDQTRSDIRWLDRLIAHEREMIEEHPVEKLDKEKKVEQKGGQQAPLEGESRRVSAAGA